MLSADRLGLGEDYGLAGSAIRAGVKSVLGTLNHISDQGTALLMTTFYEELSAGCTKSEALRRAQLALLNGENYGQDRERSINKGGFAISDTERDSRARKISHPFYWANFIIVGSPW